LEPYISSLSFWDCLPQELKLHALTVVGRRSIAEVISDILEHVVHHVDLVHVLGEVAYGHWLNDGVDLGIDVLLIELLVDLLLLLAVH